MVPKKAKDFRKATAKDTGYSEELICSVLDFYWTRVRKEISDLTYPSINIPSLGTFKVKHWKLDEAIEHYEHILGRIDGNFSKYKMAKDIRDKVEKIKNIKDLKAIEDSRLNIKKEKRKNDELENNMEEQSPDMGGVQEQDLQERSNRKDIQQEEKDM